MDPELNARLEGAAGMACNPEYNVKTWPRCAPAFYQEAYFCNLYEDDKSWAVPNPGDLAATASAS
eukprot:5210767-Lingulodinium_polyedra.AAC.1